MVKKKKTLKKSILSCTIPFMLLMCVILSAVQIISTRNILYTRYESYIRNILSYVQGEIDVDDLAECMKSGVESEKYKALQKVLDNCRDRLDIHFIYVIEPLNTERFNNIRNVIAGVSKDEYENLADELVYLNMPTGDSYSPETAAKYLNAYRSGKLSFFEEVSEWGDDYTGLLPLFDSRGKAVAALCVDVDVAEMHSILHNEAIAVILLIMLFGIAFVVIFIGWSVRSITDPIERLEKSVVDFASKCKDQKDPAALVIDVPEIRTNNEVETLAHAVSEMGDAMQDYLKGMVTAENAARAAQKIAELKASISSGMVYAHIVQTLIRGYKSLYYVDIDTEEFTEYKMDEETDRLIEKPSKYNFFDKCLELAYSYVHPDDRDTFIKTMDRETLLKALDQDKTLMLTYRIVVNDTATYVNIKIARVAGDEKHIIVGVADVDKQTKQLKLTERLQEERIAYERINALTGDFICIYVILPKNGAYREYSAADSFEEYKLPKEGRDFFALAREKGAKLVYPGDLDRYLSVFTEENVMAEIRRSGMYTLTYRLIIGGRPTHVQLRAAMVEEKDGPRLIVGINNIESHVRQEEEYENQLAEAQREANRDALTGVKNKHAYLDAEAQLDRQIAKHRAPEFAIAMIDVNDLKLINDTHGHQAGDQYLRDASGIICNIFKHSPVFRVGGDEFAVIVQDKDYECIEELMGKVRDHNIKAIKEGGIVIACGMSRFDNDVCVAQVFERADTLMYKNKNDLKTKKDRILLF